MAATISRSPVSEPAPLLNRAKPATVALPRPENSQNIGFGRSPPRRTPKMAVASGRRPMKTMERADVMCWSASAVSSGKPTTTPSPTTTSEPTSLRSGFICRRTTSNAAARAAAITARAEVRNSGEKSPTATRVAGKEPLKMMTPRSPLPHPSVVRFMSPRFRRRDPKISGLVQAETVQYNSTKLYWYTRPHTCRRPE